MIIKDSQKVVDYFGMKLTVPNEKGWVAVNDDEEVFWHKSKPFKNIECSCWDSWSDDALILICTAHLDGMDWKDTLMEV